mmetsp:Transcript_35563/g.57043  ORF Transcript_35563/g.57043 Transcript_35563/m.57043 type:complete len:313 (-) Transcript_35563:1190-2128(-)|eukprot:CAMPEP_0197020578 /NCGR_PEP_ID=MMETSP1384-20130603/1391_1 /TAXON_ID=29189 /ORGANISM="Ammonia sp." /LENGTH=312 /DNA_ID=CAMNT_0042448233 /DNA_START=206 /DNA_END=1144 /DNA_ORIENTATION=+
MIVINKRYYDYDYDNNTIIMFDADDDSDSAVQLASNPLADKKETHSSSMIGQLESQSQSTETVPDDLIKAPSMSKSSSIALHASAAHSGANDHDALPSTPPAEEKDAANDSGIGSVSWISSTSPKGSRRIPYAIQIAHSYTINKLEVQLTTLVDVATIHKQQQQQLLVYQQQQYEYQQQLQREHDALVAQQYEYQQRYYRGQHVHGHPHAAAAAAAHRQALAAQAGPPPHPHPPAHAHRGHVAVHAAHPAQVQAQQRARYGPPREMPAVPAMQMVPDGIAYVGHRAQQRYPPPRPGHTMRPVMVQKDRYHAK